MRILIWHVHGGWTDAFVLGGHDYFFPWREDEADNWGGRNGRDWPSNAFDVTADELKNLDLDAVILQNVDEIELTQSLLGRRLGRGCARCVPRAQHAAERSAERASSARRPA